MLDHIAYLKYVLRHKWYVFKACIKLKVPLWLAISHDWTKFTPREWSPYVHNFFNTDGTRKKARDSSGAYNPIKRGAAFTAAWMSHQKNRHHWQAWLSIGDYGKFTICEMPEKYIREMIADWTGAGMAIAGCKNPRPWYEANKNTMLVHPNTVARIKTLLDEHFGNSCK